MWVFALFDLPVTTPKARKRYTQFRRLLLNEGFSMLQFSVYARYCVGDESAETFRIPRPLVHGASSGVTSFHLPSL